MTFTSSITSSSGALAAGAPAAAGTPSGHVLRAAVMLIAAAALVAVAFPGALNDEQIDRVFKLVPVGGYCRLDGFRPEEIKSSSIYNSYCSELNGGEQLFVFDPFHHRLKLVFSAAGGAREIAFFEIPTVTAGEEEKEQPPPTGLSTAGKLLLAVEGGYFQAPGAEISRINEAVNGKRAALDDDRFFRRRRNLVEFDAQAFTLQWCEPGAFRDWLSKVLIISPGTADQTNYLTRIEAVGTSVYWRDTLELIMRIKFLERADAESLERSMNSDQEARRALCAEVLKGIFPRISADAAFMPGLERLIQAGRRGAVLEITIKLVYDDLQILCRK